MNDVKHVHAALVRAIAGRKVPDAAVEAGAKNLAGLKHKIRGIDICKYGICIDLILNRDEWIKAADDLIQTKGGTIRHIECFPWGIPDPDLVRVRIGQQLDGMPEMQPLDGHLG